MKRKQIISPNYSFLHGPELLGAMNGEVPSLVKGKGGICGWDSEEVCIHHATWIQPELNEAPLNPAMAGEDWNISCHINKQRCHQLSSVAQSCPTLCDPMNRSMPGLLSITTSRNSPKLMSIESVMPSSHLILCRPLLLLLPIPPSIRVFPNVLVLHIRWPKYWNFSFSISPSNEYSGLISFRMDWLDLLAV